MADAAPVLICAGDALKERGLAVRFEARVGGETRPAFVVRYQGRAYGWVNACRHLPLELDLVDGRVFDRDGDYLVCSAHGALYAPDSGLCVAGPCAGASLTPLAVHENDAGVYHLPENHTLTTDAT